MIEEVRSWITVSFSGVTALFAGLLWWLARKATQLQLELVVTDVVRNSRIEAALQINNRSPRAITIDRVSVLSPMSLRIGPRGSATRFTPGKGTVELLPLELTELPMWEIVASGERREIKLDLELSGGGEAGSVSLELRVIVANGKTRQKRKTVSARLPKSGKRAVFTP